MTGEQLRIRLRDRGLLDPCEAIRAEHHATWDEVASPTRQVHVVRVRHGVMRVLRDAGLSYPAIGALLDRHHASVMYALGDRER